MITDKQISACVEVARRYHARRLVLFGSAAEDPRNARDIDLVCEGVEGHEFFRMGAEMEEITGASIDLVPVPPLSKFAQLVLSQGRVLHET